MTAAERVLVRGGIDALTTNRVAEVAGVSIGTLYQYFPNKNAIVAALFDRYLTIFDDIFSAAIDESSTLEGAALKLATAVAARFETQPTIFRELWRLRTAAAAHDRIAAQHSKMIESLDRFLGRLGVSDKDRSRAIAFMLVHAGDGIANAVANSSGAADPGQIAMLFVQMVSAFTRALPEIRPREDREASEDTG